MIMRMMIFLLLAACAGGAWQSRDFEYSSIVAGKYEIATWQRMSDNISPVHIYIEGDGNAFDDTNHPTNGPTPHGRTVRDLAARDTSPNVVYMARPCQFIMSPTCTVHDWTDARFSASIIDSMATAIKTIANGRDVVLIGYSGGALISGLVVSRYPEICVSQWITVAGVLNHSDWTEYFGDSPLKSSLNMDTLPRISMAHYVAEHDIVVPRELSERWTGGNITVVPNSTHTDFSKLEIIFDK